MAEHLTPVRRQIVVPVAQPVAFEAFTDDIGAWWPMARHSVYGEESTVSFVNGQLVEVSPERPSVWGTVLDWDPPRRFRMTWHAGTDPANATEICVRFDEVGSHSANRRPGRDSGLVRRRRLDLDCPAQLETTEDPIERLLALAPVIDLARDVRDGLDTGAGAVAFDRHDDLAAGK
jgi:uncharacterized protein YndB with AHSA1/START domain